MQWKILRWEVVKKAMGAPELKLKEKDRFTPLADAETEIFKAK